MFGIGPFELVAILALALILLGPAKFPEAGRAVGKAMREFRQVTGDLSRSINLDDVDETPRRRYSTNTIEAQSPEPTLDDRPSIENGEVKKPDENEPGPV